MKVTTTTRHAAYQTAAKFAGYDVPEHTPEAKAFAAAKQASLVKLLKAKKDGFTYKGIGTPTPRGNVTHLWANPSINTMVVLEGTQAVTVYPIKPTKYWDGRKFLMAN